MIRLALLLAPLTVAAAEPLLRVGTIEVSREAFVRRAATMRAAGKSFSGEAFLEAFIDEAALAAEAIRTGLDKDPSVRLSVEQAGEKVLADAFVNEKLAPALKPSESELLTMFHNGADMVRLEQIFVATEEEADKVKARLLAGGEFALEATHSLEARSAKNKGDTGRIARREMPPELSKAAFSAKIGEIFGPVKLPLGFAVARVVERSIADEKEYPERRPVLESFWRQSAAVAAKRHLCEKLRVKHSATLDQKFLESLGKRGDATEAELNTPFATLDGKPLPYRLLQPKIRALGSGHMQGAGIKAQFAWGIIDDRLLAMAAREAGLASSPTVIIDTAIAANQALATAMAEKLQPSPASGGEPPDAAIRKRLKQLRKDLPIKVDREAAIRAAGNPG